MKMKASTGRKLRYGGMSLFLTALIIAVIIIVNVIFSALAQKFAWYGDLTPPLLFTLSEECIDLIENGDEEYANSTKSPIEMVDEVRAQNAGTDKANEKIKIIFCDEVDKVKANSAQNYVYETAHQLQAEFPDYIEILNYNIVRNPTSVDAYRATSRTQITTTSVIIAFGTEYRIRTVNSFYVFNDDSSDEPWAYNGEKAFCASILAVTRAESPVACLTTNHGEAFTDEEFLNTLVDAGYLIETLDMASQEIPERCRLLVVFNPDTDFLTPDGVSDIDEIDKLDRFLDGTNSMMVFMDPATPRLENFESYLEEWGISFDRYEGNTRLIMDKSQAFTTDGYTFKGEYVTTGFGGSLTKDMRSRTVKPIVFKNAMSISYSDVYEPTHYKPEQTSTNENDVEFDYGTYSQDGTYRDIFDVFTTSANAVALANGVEVEVANDANLLKLMTISRESRTQQEFYSTMQENSYVLACGSVDFASTSMLQSTSYGNTDLLLTALRTMGQEPVPVGLEFKPFADDTIDTITTAESTQYTLVLSIVPAFIALVTGFVVIVRRKNR